MTIQNYTIFFGGGWEVHLILGHTERSTETWICPRWQTSMPTSQMVIAHIPLAYERNGIQSLELFKFLEAGRLTGKWKLQAWASCLSLQMLCTAYNILHHFIYVYISLLHVYMYIHIHILVCTIYILRCSPNASIRLKNSSAHHTLSVLLSCGRYRQSWLLGGCDLEVELEGIAFYFSFPFDC